MTDGYQTAERYVTQVGTLLLMGEDDKLPGERIKELRESLGIKSAREAGRRAGEALSWQQINYLEKHPGETWPDVGIGTLRTLATIYGTSLDFMVRLALGRGLTEQEQAAEDAQHLEVHPDWLTLPVYGSVSAGDSQAEPVDGKIAYVPREHLERRGANLNTLRTYIVNGDCMVSDDAKRASKNYAHGDFIVVDYTKAPADNDVVVAWWDNEEKLVLKKFGETEGSLVLYPLKSSGIPIVLSDPADLRILGVVIWRGG